MSSLRITLPADFSFGRLDGGNGTDVFVLDAAGGQFDLRTLRGDQLNGLEVIDITGSGNNVLLIDPASVFGAVGFEADSGGQTTTRELVIEGDGGDAVDLIGGWLQTDTVIRGGDGYSVYVDPQTDTQLMVNEAVSVSAAG